MKKPEVRPERNAAGLGLDIAQLQSGAHDREHAVAEAEKAHKAALVDGDAGSIAKAAKALSDARGAVEHANARLEALRERQAELIEQEREATRVSSYRTAVASIAKHQAEMEKLLRRMAADAESYRQHAARAVSAADTANSDLPEGAEPLMNADTDLRTVPAVPEEIVSETVVHSWCHRGSWRTIRHDAHVTPDKGNPDIGYAQAPGGPAHDVERKPFRVIRFRPAVAAVWPEPLDAALRVPALASDMPREPRHVQERWEPILTPIADAAE